jgi:hypothetical protein
MSLCIKILFAVLIIYCFSSGSTQFFTDVLKVEEILKCKKPKLRYFAGRPDQGFASVLRHVLPDSLIGCVVRKNFGVA